jgi:hypothetical protein
LAVYADAHRSLVATGTVPHAIYATHGVLLRLTGYHRAASVVCLTMPQRIRVRSDVR